MTSRVLILEDDDDLRAELLDYVLRRRGACLYATYAGRLPGTRWILMSANHGLVRLGKRLSSLVDLSGCSVIDKPVPLRLLGRLLFGRSTPASPRLSA